MKNKSAFWLKFTQSVANDLSHLRGVEVLAHADKFIDGAENFVKEFNNKLPNNIPAIAIGKIISRLILPILKFATKANSINIRNIQNASLREKLSFATDGLDLAISLVTALFTFILSMTKEGNKDYEDIKQVEQGFLMAALAVNLTKHIIERVIDARNEAKVQQTRPKIS